MKYFKPALLAKCRSSDPNVAEAAATKWQKNAEAYRQRLQEIRDRLPASVRSLLRSITLHDADLLTSYIARRPNRNQLFLTFRLADRDRQAGVQLCYDTVTSLEIVDHEPNATGDTGLCAVYDEFDVLNDGTLTHSILMTGGVETRIKFTRLFVTYLDRVAAPGRGQSGIKEQLGEMVEV